MHGLGWGGTTMTGPEDFEKVIKERGASYKGATLSIALERKEGALEILRGVLRFTDSTSQPEKRLDYGRMVLLRESLTSQEALEFIEALESGKAPTGLGTSPIQFTFQRVDWKQYENIVNPVGQDRLSEWPAEEFLLRSTGTSSSEPHEPLVKSSLPLIVYPSQAIDEWIGTK